MKRSPSYRVGRVSVSNTEEPWVRGMVSLADYFFSPDFCLYPFGRRLIAAANSRLVTGDGARVAREKNLPVF